MEASPSRQGRSRAEKNRKSLEPERKTCPNHGQKVLGISVPIVPRKGGNFGSKKSIKKRCGGWRVQYRRVTDIETPISVPPTDRGLNFPI